MKTRHFLSLLTAGLLFSASALAGFWDPLFDVGGFRSDFSSPSTGTVYDPIVLGTPYNGSTYVNSNCLDGTISPSTWDPAITFVDNDGSGTATPGDEVYWPSVPHVDETIESNYWVLHANMESWCRNAAGPPGVSAFVGDPGQAGAGMAVKFIHNDPAPDAHGAHLIINTDLLSASQLDDWDDLPFLSLGAEQDRGNGGLVTYSGYYHWDILFDNYLTFDAQIFDADEGDASALHAGVYLMMEWDGKRRGLFVDLYDYFPGGGQIYSGGITNWPGGWDWPFGGASEDSFFAPGADWIFTTIDWWRNYCPQALLDHDQELVVAGGRKTFGFALQTMLDCIASQPGPNPESGESHTWTSTPPSQFVPIQGVHWFVEGAKVSPGDLDVKLWLNVDNPQVH